MLTGSDLGSKHVHYRWCMAYNVSCWHCQRAGHSLGSAKNCLRPTVLQRSVCTLDAKESHRWWQHSFYGTVWIFLVSFGHVTLITESRFGAATWLITQNLKPGKGCVIEKLSSSCSKRNESIVIGKDDRGKLSWDHKYVLVLDFLDHGDTVCRVLLWYTLLTAAILCKRPRLLHQRIILLHANARHHTANWTYSCLWLYIW